MLVHLSVITPIFVTKRNIKKITLDSIAHFKFSKHDMHSPTLLAIAKVRLHHGFQLHLVFMLICDNSFVLAK